MKVIRTTEWVRLNAEKYNSLRIAPPFLNADGGAFLFELSEV